MSMFKKISIGLQKFNVDDFYFTEIGNLDGEFFIVKTDDPLNPIDVETLDVASCFGHEHRIPLTDYVDIDQKQISIFQARKIAKKNNLYQKYSEYIEKNFPKEEVVNKFTLKTKVDKKQNSKYRDNDIIVD